MEMQQWEYCYLDIGSSSDNSWICKVTYFNPGGITYKELPALKRNRSDNENLYFKIIGTLGLHGWEAISLSTSSPRNITATGYFKRPIVPGRSIDDLQVML